MVRVGTDRGPCSSQLAEPPARIWGLRLPTSLIHQVGPGDMKITETNEMRTVVPGSTELDAQHTDGAQQS